MAVLLVDYFDHIDSLMINHIHHIDSFDDQQKQRRRRSVKTKARTAPQLFQFDSAQPDLDLMRTVLILITLLNRGTLPPYIDGQM